MDDIYSRSLDLLGADAAPVLRHFAALQRLLPALTDHDTRQLGRRCGIAPQHIVSLPWHPTDLPPPISRMPLKIKSLVCFAHYCVVM